MAVSGDPEAGFTQLLSSLNQRLKDTTVSVPVHRGHLQAKEELRLAKLNWLQASVLYEEVKEMALCREIAEIDSEESLDHQMSALLRNSLAFAEIADYAENNTKNSEDKCSLLGITQADIQRLNSHKKHVKTLQHKFVPEIEERLRSKCETMLEFHAPAKSSSSDELKCAQSTQLPALVEADVRRLDEKRAVLRRTQLQHDEQFWACYEATLQCISDMERLVKDIKFRSHSEYNQVKTNFLVTHCDALCSKLRKLELETLCDMYTAEVVSALHTVKRHLDDECATTHQEHQHVTQTLTTYESVGLRFEELVTEYSALKKEFDTKKWMLEEFSTSK